MKASLDGKVVAIDGGGTYCRIALTDGQDSDVVETGSANVSTDFDGALAQMKAGLVELARRADLAPDLLARCPAFVGVAGIFSQDFADQVAKALPFKHTRVQDDQATAFRGAFADREGVLAHCGTGSYASQGGGVRCWGMRHRPNGLGVVLLPMCLSRSIVAWMPHPCHNSFYRALGVRKA